MGIKRGYNYTISTFEKAKKLIENKLIYLDIDGEKKVLDIISKKELSKEDIQLFGLRACELSYGKLFLEMVKRGLDIHYIDKDGINLAVSSAMSDSWRILKYLIIKGVKFNYRTSYGPSALHYAARIGCKESCKVLIRSGADVNMKTTDDKKCLGSFGEITPLRMAMQLNNEYLDLYILALEESYKGSDILIPNKLDAERRQILYRLIKFNQEAEETRLLVDSMEDETDEDVLNEVQAKLDLLKSTRTERIEERARRLERIQEEIKKKEKKAEEKGKERKEEEKQLGILRKEMFKDYLSGGDSMEFKNNSDDPLNDWKNIRIKIRDENKDMLGYFYSIYPYTITEKMAYLLQEEMKKEGILLSQISTDRYHELFKIADNEGMSGFQASFYRNLLRKWWIHGNKVDIFF